MAMKMLASLTVILMAVPSSAWYGGAKCIDPSSSGSDQCENKECRIPPATSRRRAARVGAKFCHQGLYKHVWYTTTTTEAQCNATPGTGIFASLEAPMPHETDENGRKGLCYTTRAAQVHHSKDEGESVIVTCAGVADYKPPMKKGFTGQGCNASKQKWKYETYVEKYSNGKPAMCFCNSDERMYTPTSECGSCEVSEHQCRTQDLCTKAKEGRCSWAGNSCTCKSGRYRQNNVCINGQLHDVYYGTASNCKSKAIANTLKRFPSAGNRRRGGTQCETRNGTQSADLGGGKHGNDMKYQSQRQHDCAGIPDGHYPRRQYYAQPFCGGTPLHANYSRQEIWPTYDSENNCGCLPPTQQIQSGCRDCEGGSVECSTKDSCLASESGMCSWNGNACKCSTQLFKSEHTCKNNLPHEVWYQNVAISVCKAGTLASSVFQRPIDVADDSDYTQCRQNYDMDVKKQHPNATHMKQRTCNGVADGQQAKVAYYKDSKCTQLDHLGAPPSWSTEDVCTCELYLGCKQGTTYEKYFCAADGKTTAMGFSDAACKTASGVNRTLPSLTDALNPGVCGAWPPMALNPNFDGAVILTCPNVGGPVNYKHWRRPAPTMTDQTLCKPADTPASQGPIASCHCTDEFMFNAIAANSNLQVEGEMTMSVSNVAAAVADDKFKGAVKETIAEQSGVSPNRVVNLVLTAARRLAHEEIRRLTSGSIKASYIIVIPKAMETQVKAALTSIDKTAISAKIQQKVTSAGLSYTVAVTQAAAPTIAPATVAVTATGTISAAGVSASGAVVIPPAPNTTAAPANTTAPTGKTSFAHGTGAPCIALGTMLFAVSCLV